VLDWRGKPISLWDMINIVARESYTDNGALDVFTHVRDFMQRLAGQISTTYTRHFKKEMKKMVKKNYQNKKSK
jgi:hypothetical protein